MDSAASAAETEMRKLQGGPAVSVFGASLPVRILLALAIFIAVFMVVLMALWSMIGGLGLGLGWILAMGAGLVAVKLYADRASREQ